MQFGKWDVVASVFKPFFRDGIFFHKKNMKCRLGHNIKFDLLCTFEFNSCSFKKRHKMAPKK